MNLDWLNLGASPRPIDMLGFDWVRLIAHPRGSVHPDPARSGETLGLYIEQLRAQGIRSILVLPLQSFGDVGSIVPRLQEYVADLNPDAWQIGNEPDANWHPNNTPFENSAAERHRHAPASWCMDADDYANLIFNCAPVIRAARPRAQIITAGMACGFPDWLDGPTWNAILEKVDGVAVHPYLKRPEANWPRNHVVEGEERIFVGDLLKQYKDAVGQDTPLWVTEFGTTDRALHTEYYARMYCTLEARDDVRAAIAFCYSDSMDDRGYGLLDSPAWEPLLAAPPLRFM